MPATLRFVMQISTRSYVRVIRYAALTIWYREACNDISLRLHVFQLDGALARQSLLGIVENV